MGSSGLEPPTSRLSGARSNLLSYEPAGCARAILAYPYFEYLSLARSHCLLHIEASSTGDDGIRTHDPLLAGQVLSQLSYTPIFSGFLFRSLKIEQPKELSTQLVLRFISS